MAEQQQVLRRTVFQELGRVIPRLNERPGIELESTLKCHTMQIQAKMSSKEFGKKGGSGEKTSIYAIRTTCLSRQIL